MKKFNQAQLKGIAQFLNAIAVAWFTAGVIAPFFIKQEDVLKFGAFALYAIIISVGFLWGSLKILRRVR